MSNKLSHLVALLSHLETRRSSEHCDKHDDTEDVRTKHIALVALRQQHTTTHDDTEYVRTKHIALPLRMFLVAADTEVVNHSGESLVNYLP